MSTQLLQLKRPEDKSSTNSSESIQQTHVTCIFAFIRLEVYIAGNRTFMITVLTGQFNQTTYYFGKRLVRVINSSGTFDTLYIHDEKDLIARKELWHNKTFYYYPDHLGSTSVVVNETGAVVEETTYEPFGKVASGGSDRFLYTGKELDTGTGLEYYGARYYDPSKASQFVQPDSVIADPYNPQNLNRYSYVLNNPYKYTDPTGNIPNKEQLGVYDEVYDYIVSVEQSNPSLNADQTLAIVERSYRNYENSPISVRDSPSYSPNFIYTEDRGVIDQRHFFFNARFGRGDAGKAGMFVFQHAWETGQAIFAQHSSYTYEDLVSNEVGRDFGNTINNNQPLSSQYKEFIGNLRPNQFPDSLVAQMPEKELGYKPSESEKKYTSSGKALPSSSNNLLNDVVNRVKSFFGL